MLFSRRFSRKCLEGISFKFFVCFIFNVLLGSAPTKKNFDIQGNTRVGSGGQFTSNRLSCHHNHYHQKFHYYGMNCRIKFFTLERFLIERFSVFEDVTSNSNLYIQGNMTPPCLVNSPPKNPYSNLHILHISSCHDFNLKLSKHSEQTCNLSRKLRFWFV